MTDFDFERFQAELSNIPKKDVNARLDFLESAISELGKMIGDLQRQIDLLPETYELKDKMVSPEEIEKEE